MSCRKVRGAAAHALASLSSTNNTAIYRRIMTQIDRFFHEDDSVGLLTNYASDDKSIEKTMEIITDMVLKNIYDQGNIIRK